MNNNEWRLYVASNRSPHAHSCLVVFVFVFAEIHSMMNHPNSRDDYENLQLNPEDLVTEIQSEVEHLLQEGGSNTLEPAEDEVTSSEKDPKRPPKPAVVPFLVRKLVSAPKVIADGANKKRSAGADSAAEAPPAKASRTSEANDIGSASDRDHAASLPRVTRSHGKEASDVATGSKTGMSIAMYPSQKEIKTTKKDVNPVVKNETKAPKKDPTEEVAPAALLEKQAVVSDASTSGSVGSGNEPSKPEAAAARPNACRKQERVPAMVSPVYNEEKEAKPLLKTSSADTKVLPLPTLGKKSSNNVNAKTSPSPKAKNTPKSPGPGYLDQNTGKYSNIPVPVNTSSAHVRALTGENGASVSLCAKNCALEIAGGDDIGSSEEATNKKNANLTEEQRAQQSRDRNRRHAR